MFRRLIAIGQPRSKVQRTGRAAKPAPSKPAATAAFVQIQHVNLAAAQLMYPAPAHPAPKRRPLVQNGSCAAPIVENNAASSENEGAFHLYVTYNSHLWGFCCVSCLTARLCFSASMNSYVPFMWYQFDALVFVCVTLCRIRGQPVSKKSWAQGTKKCILEIRSA